jgi:hypothetical protein
MFREQRMMFDMVRSLGEKLDEYIDNFHNCDLWYFREGELIVNKTFKELLSIVATYNLTSVDELLKGAYRLIESNNDAMLSIIGYMGDTFLTEGSTSILNRTVVFCFALYTICQRENVKASEVLKVMYDYDLFKKKETWWTKLLYKIKIYNYPFKLEVNKDGMILVSLLTGNNVKDTIDYVLKVNGVEC